MTHPFVPATEDKQKREAALAASVAAASRDGFNGFLRPRVAAGVYNVSRSTLYRLVAAGHLPKPAPLGARAGGWRRSDLDAAFANLPPRDCVQSSVTKAAAARLSKLTDRKAS